MSAAAAPIIEANKLRKTVRSPEGDLTILHDVDLSIGSGESLAVVGASGSGSHTVGTTGRFGHAKFGNGAARRRGAITSR